ncbi:MAG: NADPH:quinone oxidoreductase family protein [Burkholderiales bacterium]
MTRSPALRCHRLAEDLSGVSLDEVEVPPPGPGEVLVAMRAAALNFPDLLMTRGGYQHKPALPFTIGMEGAGVVEAVGAGVTGWRPGDRVCVSDKTGAIARHAVYAASALSPVPTGWDWPSASGWQVGALTAYVALVTRGALRAGETLLVHGATGGMGAAAVQLGAALGATVIATGSDPAWLERLRPMGATHLVSSRGEFNEQVKALTGGRGADVIYDPVGGDVFDRSTKCVAPFGGRLLVVGFAAGRIPTLAANHVLIKSYSVIGVRAGEWLRQRPAEAPGIRAEIARLAEAGTFKPLIGARFPLGSAVDALRALETRRAPGKIVVDLGED